MNFKTDDLLYGFMRSMSTARPVENGKWQEYLPKKEFVASKRVIAAICGCSTKTIERHINALFEAGLLDEGIEVVTTTDNKGKEITYEYPCYWFPCDESENYKLLEKDMVRYLVDTRNAQCIKVYLYLLSKYEWKKDYEFTQVELQLALGYSEKSKDATISMGNIIDSLAREGIIKFETSYEYIDGNYKVPKKTLKFVAKSVNELRSIE